MTPEELYSIVEQYSAFGDHHTGTAADRSTTAWIGELLAPRAASLDLLPYEFLQWSGSADLKLADGRTVPCLPVFYSHEGSVTTSDLTIVEADRSIAGRATGLDETLEDTPDAEALIVALDGPDDEPVQCNRVPSGGGHRPAVIVPHNWRSRLDGARLDFAGETRHATSHVLTAVFGPHLAPPVVVTTPLTGWFRCAGERGTGLAAALALVDDLARDYRVHFVGCSGHEIDHQGLQAWLATDNPIPGGRVIHLGASVGAVERTPVGGAELASSRVALTTVRDNAQRHDLGEAVETGRFSLIDVDPWMGEGTNWRAAGASVLSFLGGSSLFHTSADLPDVATTPAALEQATNAVIGASRMFVTYE